MLVWSTMLHPIYFAGELKHRSVPSTFLRSVVSLCLDSLLGHD